MNTATYFAYPDAEAQAQGLAQAVAALLRHHISCQDHAVLAVSGGRSPIAVFEALSQIELPWHKVAVTLVDERWVPANHADSNGALVRRHLLQHHAALAQWQPLVAENADDLFFRQPENVAASVAAALANYRQPDVVLLGMGDDGHTASLFPSAPQLPAALAADAPALLHTTPVSAPHERISLSLSAIATAANVLLAIGGSSKRRVLQQALAAHSAALPVGLVLNHPQVSAHIHYHE